MRRYRLPLSLALAAWLIAGCTPSKPEFNGTDLGRVEWGRDFTLQAHTGKQVSTADFRGKVVILYFGYLDCPDICAPTLARLAALRKTLGPEAERVQVLFVTVDPRRDTPERLASFVAKFDPSFIGLTGTPDQIAAVVREYKIVYSEKPAPSSHAHAHAHRTIDHSSGMFVKDGNGKLRLFFNNDVATGDVAHDVRLLLTERAV